jgi:hypothetical protein
MTLSAEPTVYSKLGDILKGAGIANASMSTGEIDQGKLSPYEIVVYHPSPERPLKEHEISALVWFVAQHGGALFVHGGTPAIVNPLIEIFGISIDGSTLVDSTSSMEEAVGARKFLLSRFPPSAASAKGQDEIKSIGFYGGAPLILTSDAKAIVTGDDDCYSDNGLYSLGSFPPVAAIAYFGRGVVLVKTDRTIFSNGNIEDYDNAAWAGLIFDRIRHIQQGALDRDESILGLQSRVARLRSTRKTLEEERGKIEADLTVSYAKSKELKGELEKSLAKNDDFGEELDRLTGQNDRLSKRLSRYEAPNTLKIAAAVGATILLFAFLVGLLLGRRRARNRV